MELESNEYEKCLEILPESAEQVEMKIIPAHSYSEAEIQYLSFLGLDQWKGIGLVSIPPLPLISATQNISSDVKGQVKKRPREEAIEYAAKALYELSSLRDLAKMAIKTEQQLIQPYFRKSATLNTSVSIPFQQRMAVMTARFSSSQQSLQEALSIYESSVRNHARIVDKLKVLGKYWKLHTSNSDRASRDASISFSYGTQLAVDCSLVSYGDHPSTLVDYLVPLSIKDDQISIPMKDLSHHVSTLEFKLCHRQFGVIAQTSVWDVVSSEVEPSMSSDLGEDLAIINDYCRKRQHDALCSRLFGRLRFNALDFKTNWVLSRHDRLQTSTQHDNAVISAMLNDGLLRAIEIWSLERGSLHLALSSDLSIFIALVPINEHHVSMDNEENSFQVCIVQAYKLARSYLFHIFSQTLDESSSSSSAASFSTVVSSAAAAVTGTSSSSKQVPQITVTNADSSSIGAIMGRAKTIDMKKVKPTMVGGASDPSKEENSASVLIVLMNTLKVKIWKLLLESSCNGKPWELRFVRSTTTPRTAEVLASQPTVSNEEDVDYSWEEYHYEINYREVTDRKVSLEVTCRGYRLTLSLMTNSSTLSNTILRDFTSTRDLLNYLQSSLV
jgi:hypothetical protein